MNKTILITGANSGIGKETARQLALLDTTEKIYLVCRNLDRAILAKDDLEKSTGRSIFEIIIMDVANIDSVKDALKYIYDPIDAVILNAGGLAGSSPEQITKDGVTFISASNLLGHVVLVEELLKLGRINNTVLFAGTEAARGVKVLGVKRPALNNSVQEFTSILNGQYFGDSMDNMEAYSLVKYIGALWISYMAKQHPHIQLITVSPGGTQGTSFTKELPFFQKFMFDYIMMPFLLPLMGMTHSLQKGSQRFVDSIQDPTLSNGGFYASKEKVTAGPMVEQSSFFGSLKNEGFQKNAYDAIQSFLA
ncbi:SDR family NAD(P)-dependent oxidoreductase [Flammeovirga agarivorans]|uniref:SDR family NAD(P)-dependent oxidoreductase n=1 Tax=Flammeovirga agarivorans TaxID=2726742 RepID=A0A7X8SJX0_9BACT|nr:SDR family NAD(P)-dependent oxidoreductase [Flammeovirga agarivorans]NLR91492.1 SDR family NAD(P)-dependent oxidoreductase [Flammeovirga agarivorans]